MKQIRFEKVVEGDNDYLESAWSYGIISMGIPFIVLL